MTTSSTARLVTDPYDVEAIRADFPILARTMHDKPLAFLDSAASAQKPRHVIDAVSDVYEREYANVHRGLYQISEAVTERYEGTRDIIRDFIGAANSHEIIFTRNATESINLIAHSFGRAFLKEGDGSLRSGIEFPQGIDAVSEELDAHRVPARIRIYVQNAAAPGDFAGFVHECDGFVALVEQLLPQCLGIDVLVEFDPDGRRGIGIG